MSETEQIKPGAQQYDESQIQVLEGLEAVRKRPGMYIGTTGSGGLHHLVYEIVDNSIDEALAGYCTHIQVEILPGDIIRVTDNGRGIPTGIHPKEGISAATVVYTVLHAGGKFGGGGYKVAGGLHGVGASVVNALSEWLELTVKDGSHVHFQRFERGNYAEPLKIIGDTTEHGTSVMFKPDAEIFEETTVFDYEILLKRMREQAFLNAGLTIELSDQRDPANPQGEKMCYEGGIRQFIEHIHKTRGLESLSEQVIYFTGSKGDNAVEIAMQYNDSYNELILSFANNVHTIDGGMHELGFRNALTKTLNEYGKRFGLLKDDSKLMGEDVREGLTAIISVKLTDCQFESQTKVKLGNPEIKPFVGDSAGGSAKEGRDRRYQAILPLWGKMLNVEKARIDKVYCNEKLMPVVTALGTSIGEDFDISKLRYGKVIIMADADVDGSHIRTLLLTFFFRFMRPLITNGNIYIAQPPLFRVAKGKTFKYAFSDEERDKYIAQFNGESPNAKVEVQRYKGLGEMDAHQLWDTTMNPDTRTMIKVEMADAVKADETFSILMGDKVAPRREFIEKNAKYAQNLDI